MFNHVDLDLPALSRETIDGVRYYQVPDAEELLKLVSITSVTSHKNRAFFAKWRKKVGEETADRITRQATSRGTDMHTLTECYLKNEGLPEVQPLSDYLFKIAKPELNKIDNIHAEENNSKAEDVKAKEAPKEVKKPKPVEWIEHYFVQCMAYGCMLYELTGISVKKLVIIMACENGECVVYEERDKTKYIKLLQEYIREFLNYKLETYAQ